MLIEKIYFKWNRNFESGPLKLDTYISKKILQNEFYKDSNDEVWHYLKSNKNIKIKLDLNNKINTILFYKNSKMGDFHITWKHIDVAREEFKQKLNLCQKNYDGDKLELIFGDSYLGAAKLIRKQSPTQ